MQPIEIILTILVWLAVVVAFLYYRLRLRQELPEKTSAHSEQKRQG